MLHQFILASGLYFQDRNIQIILLILHVLSENCCLLAQNQSTCMQQGQSKQIPTVKLHLLYCQKAEDVCFVSFLRKGLYLQHSFFLSMWPCET